MPLEEEDWVEKAEEIAVEYASLFVVPGDDYIPPYESFYRDALSIDHTTANSPYFQADCMPMGGMKGFLYGSSARKVERAYRQGGFELDPRFHELPDHTACELEFVGRCELQGKIDAVEDFVRDHLVAWVFHFLDNLKMQTRSIFYQKVGVCTDSFLKQERRLKNAGC